MTQTNDIILRTTTTLIAFILLGFSVYLFFAGHNAPGGGGFIGGLMTAAAIILMYMAYGSKAMEKILPINFRFLIPVGLMVAAATGIGGMLFDAPFLTQTFAYFQLPILGKTELATALLFDLGVYLAVVGVTMTIILTIAYDRE
ncbi:Na(+)/H(+) antiporter subunit B [Halobacillus litoralis]|uniref:Na(+)/H(+) antiporter subunit B n=1 Tax=Halobacillus litoralis TaxID=45668 RepID=UPI00273FFDE4|nr:Na(+)/H(+) antiporter subunit B [Halobacillus litoralis]WLR46864.1 Na(+)/H(+) antiporter subunit B [Halobacillus litoralis]